MKKSLEVKDIVAVGIGTAVFVILFKFIAIPTGIPNTEIQVAYGFLALMSVLYGPVAGFLIGFIGHTIKDFTTYGSAWWSWIICSGILGYALGIIGRKINLEEGELSKKQMIHFNIWQVVANAIIWIGIAPVLDILIYAEPANKVFTQGVLSFFVNTIAVGVVGTLLMKAYAASRTKKGSLSKD
ncbi:ECF-type riboflavin transporter substrate-binding protein [Vagococcus jeotgali]|uniref:ECF-type riboflavin transporter substrate-binding protein n=1 Tax=Vagococcus jeotgali TaxID=3109030 RepID=UPI002DD97685|nr:ECF-type riboflavin transporter substrate-binding protein [Vagococcus sp. B2T-5]